MRLIVIDGLDGSGKTTQFDRIRTVLETKFKVRAISFPDYDSESSALIKMYLRGDFGLDADKVNVYAASSFYAADRFASFRLLWEDSYNAGELILASRYVSSNAIHQMGKLDRKEWDGYLDWLYDYEYIKLKLPKPDLVIFLDMPHEAAMGLLNKRYGGDEAKKDIHESNAGYLKKCRAAALYAANRDNWAVIPCGEGSVPFSQEKITEAILNVINEKSDHNNLR